jgi:hypothetical protein
MVMMSVNGRLLGGRGEVILLVCSRWGQMGSYEELGRKELRPLFTTARQVNGGNIETPNAYNQ